MKECDIKLILETFNDIEAFIKVVKIQLPNLNSLEMYVKLITNKVTLHTWGNQNGNVEPECIVTKAMLKRKMRITLRTFIQNTQAIYFTLIILR